MIKGLLKLAVIFMVGHALFKFVPPYWDYTQFKWELKEKAVSWREHNDAAVLGEVLAIAANNDIPITQEQVHIRREPDHLFLDVAYDRTIEFLPGWERRMTFDVAVDAWTLRPPYVK